MATTRVHFQAEIEDFRSGLVEMASLVLAQVERGVASWEDVDRAAKTAKAAFKDWTAMPGAVRKKLLHKIADAIVARPDLTIDQPRYIVTVTDPGHDNGPLSVVNSSHSGPTAMRSTSTSTWSTSPTPRSPSTPPATWD